MDQEELKRRRAQRRQQQAKRKQQQRALLLRLGLAAAVLVVIILAVLFLGKQEPAPEAGSPTLSTTTAPTETTEEDPLTVIHLAAVGDLNVNDTVVGTTNGGGVYDYTETFADIAHLLSDADLTVVNFEGMLSGGPYGTATHSAPTAMAQALASAGVDLIQLANSYSISQGMLGLASSIDSIRALGMEPLGVYATESDYQQEKGYTLLMVKGVKIAFVAFTKGMDGMTLPTGSENCVNLLYSDYDSTYQTINTAKINEVLDAVNEHNPDITIAMMHWGSEYNDTISSSQENLSRMLQSRGVDVILGTHSHYVQRMDYDEENGTFIAWSLGDFLSDAQRSGTEYSVILDLEITKDNISGETRVTGYTCTPIFTVVEKDQPVRILRIKEAMEAYENAHLNAISSEVYASMEYAMERLTIRLTPQKEPEE